MRRTPTPGCRPPDGRSRGRGRAGAPGAYSVTVPESTSFAYKYLKKDGSGNVTWESGTNRSYPTGTSSGYTTSDTRE